MSPNGNPPGGGSSRQDESIVAQPSLPSFSSVREPYESSVGQAESSASGSRRSITEKQSRSRSKTRTSASFTSSYDDNTDQPFYSSLPRRRPTRTSGGFLLDSKTNSPPLSRAILSKSRKDVKGKHKNDNFQLSVPKKRKENATHLENNHSIHSSPLSTEISRRISQDSGQDVEVNDNFGTVKRQKQTTESRNGSDRTPRDESPASQNLAMPAVGYDTDPSQIVDMALRLSEARRRQVSGKRYVSGSADGRRVISTASMNDPRARATSIGQYLSSPMPHSPGRSPLPQTPTRDQLGVSGHDAMSVDLASSPLSYAPNPGRMLEISRATASRVEKAKIYIELAYEHRRLLPHLPPVRDPDQPVGPYSAMPSSKIYNPLQYARNRKLRIREKSAINAEALGWHDVDKVRAWIDAIINSHIETRHDPTDCVRLPPLSLEDQEVVDQQVNSHQSPKQEQTVAKPKRPRSDWTTHPGDMIADAYWLEQGLNKTKIQDRDNNAIYPANTQFKFAGWRNFSPIDVPQNMQQPTPPPEQKVEDDWETRAAPLSAAPELPTFKSAHQKQKGDPTPDKKSKLKDKTKKESVDLRKRTFGLFDSSEDESGFGSSSDEQSVTRGRKLFNRKPEKLDLMDGDPFGKPVESARRYSDANGTVNSEDPTRSSSSKRPSIDHPRFVDYLKRTTTQKNSSTDRGRRLKKNTSQPTKAGKKKGEKLSKSSAEYETTPDSPINYGMPSIAINLSPPASRSPSPTKKKTPASFFHSRDKSRSSIDHVDATDFARGSKSHSREASVDAGRHDSSNPTSRGTSPMTKSRQESKIGSDPPSVPPSDHRASTVSRVSTRASANMGSENQSRIRGMFKGGRIAELVGNEVTRVGDFIWKREPPSYYRHHTTTSDASFRSYHQSDTDEEPEKNGHIYKTPPQLVRTPTSADSSGASDKKSPENSRGDEAPQYYNPNLPSFTSPFQKDRERQDNRDKQEKQQSLLSPDSAARDDDHISQQAAQRRSASKSPRLGKLAPPPIDTGYRTAAEDRRDSYGFGGALTKSQTASQTYNNAINGKLPSRASRKSVVDEFLRDPRKRSVIESMTGPKSSSRYMTKQDVARVKALLLISAVKAHNVSALQNEIPAEQSDFLIHTLTSRSNTPTRRQYLSPDSAESPPVSSVDRSVHVRRKDEHVLAARNLISKLSDQSNKFNTQLHKFTDNTIAALHGELQVLEDTIENTLTPRVRNAADEAGELSVKLTTTSTLAVKGLNDTIAEAFRVRKRGPVRWLRLTGYKAIELIVVGLLWVIWFVVTIARFGIKTVKGIGRVGRWLLWIE